MKKYEVGCMSICQCLFLAGSCKILHRYGSTFIGYAHGEKEKPADLTTIMARERKEDYAFSEYTEWHLGHRR